MTTNIRDAINAPYHGVETYKNLLDILNRAAVGAEFWGKRYVYVKDMEGTYPLEELYVRITNIERRDQKQGNPIFTAEEQKIGIQIVNRTTQITQSYTLHPLSKAAILTGVLVHVRGCLGFDTGQFESFHPKLIANALITVGVASCISCLAKVGLSSYYWVSGVGSRERFALKHIT